MSGDAPWWRGAVVYHVYPASFADSDGDGFGDLPGITSRLDHLAGAPGSLGVDAVWLSPFYRSPMRDFGYDVSDHRAVDPCFGTLADFDALLAAAHARGLRVIVDLVPNHTSDQHPWFQDALHGRDAARRDWYVWADPRPDGSPPNNWLSAFPRSGGAWTLDPLSGQYYLHSYTAEQPDLNWRNPAVVDAMQRVLRFWLDRGVDGFRVDAPHRLMKDPSLRDNPPALAGLRLDTIQGSGHGGERLRHIDHPDVHGIVRRLRETVDAYPGRVLLGEVGVHDPRRWARYFGERDDELNLAFDFRVWGCPWSAACFRDAVAQSERLVPAWAWPTYALSNHDIPRAATRYGAASVRLAAVLLLTLRGTAFLYYGEEIGMHDVPVPTARAHDPDGRDPCRTPMQWDGSPGAGFTRDAPWLPVAEPRAPNVAAERADPGSLLHLYRALIRLRAGSKALRAGGYEPLDGGAHVLAFERRAGEERVRAALNFGNAAASIAAVVPEGAERLLSTAPGAGRRGWLAPGEGAIYRA